jgi:hypothetical protein
MSFCKLAIFLRCTIWEEEPIISLGLSLKEHLVPCLQFFSKKNNFRETGWDRRTDGPGGGGGEPLAILYIYIYIYIYVIPLQKLWVAITETISLFRGGYLSSKSLGSRTHVRYFQNTIHVGRVM